MDNYSARWNDKHRPRGPTIPVFAQWLENTTAPHDSVTKAHYEVVIKLSDDCLDTMLRFLMRCNEIAKSHFQSANWHMEDNTNKLRATAAQLRWLHGRGDVTIQEMLQLVEYMWTEQEVLVIATLWTGLKHEGSDVINALHKAHNPFVYVTSAAPYRVF